MAQVILGMDPFTRDISRSLRLHLSWLWLKLPLECTGFTQDMDIRKHFNHLHASSVVCLFVLKEFPEQSLLYQLPTHFAYMNIISSTSTAYI